MELKQINGHIWYLPFEERRDRPNLTYIHGDRWNLAVDAGHSEEHLKEFYAALENAGLPLPDITVITHWHWDHILGMHAVHGLTLANEKTRQHIAEFKDKIERRTGIPVDMLDERLTTVEADEIMDEAGIKGKKRKEYVDMIAAQIILQDYLDNRLKR